MLSIYLAALDTEDEKLKMTEIYEQYKPIMLRYAQKLTHGNVFMAEDAVHNAFLAIIKHKEKYFSISCRELRNSIVIITKNKCIDLLRQHNMIVDEPIEEMENILQTDDDPVEDEVILKEEYETIKKHVAALDETSRLILEMRYVLELSYREIGEHLGISPKHVDTKLMRAKEKVRKLVINGGDTIG